jgi:hypothetical protein
VTGRPIVVGAWVTLVVFAALAVPHAIGVHALETAVTGVSVGLFAASIAIWAYAFGLAVVRSARGDDIVVSSWVFLTGSAPSDVRRALLGAAVVSVALALATAWANPFNVLVPMLHLGLAALWGARHGTYPPRRVAAVARGGRR